MITDRDVTEAWRRYRATLERGLPVLRRELPDCVDEQVAAIARIDQVIAARDERERG